MKIRGHTTNINGVSVFVESFSGIYLNEYDGRDGKIYVNIGSGGTIRTVPINFIEQGDAINEEKHLTIKCLDCGATRKILSQDIGRVKRCQTCQRKLNKKTRLKQ